MFCLFGILLLRLLSGFTQGYLLNISGLSTLFREDTGITLKEFILQLKTCHLFNLISSKEPLWRISKLLGYRDPGTFSKIFKKRLGFPLFKLR